MMFREGILFRLVLIASVSVSLSQCATQEVKHELSMNMERKGASFANELAAQSPFKKVEMSWAEASELMKERNPNYRQAILDKQESEIKKGRVNNFTYEVRKSLTDSVQTTLNPSEIAKAMKNPVASLPRQLESITDLKNISHSLTQSEWGRITQSVRADAAQRREIVQLHVLFYQSKNLLEAEKDFLKLKGRANATPSKVMATELTKAHALLKKEREQWLDQVRNFFNAEYYDVEFSGNKKELSFYRDVANPEFSDWKRWRMLENSERLASELQKQHGKDKPALPGINLITQNLGVPEMRSNLAQQKVLNQDMVKEVRQMLKNWRNLKSLQQKIQNSELRFSKIPVKKVPTVGDLKLVTSLYQLKKQEIDQLKKFWMIDEECWKI